MKNRALFLDRDGVINIEKNYVNEISDFEFVEGIFSLCKYFQRRNYIIIIVTNQAGIARGFYTEIEYASTTNWLLSEFKRRDILISAIYHCPHHPEITGNCDCRKPNPGMILQAKDRFKLDLSESVLIGDKLSDINCGHSARVGTNILIEPNKIPKIFCE